MLGSSHIGVVHDPDRAIPMGPALDLRQAYVPKGEGGEHLEKGGCSLANPLVLGCKYYAGFEWPISPWDYWLPS